MDILTYRDYCLSKPGTEEATPFDENTLVFKVMGKMFALAGMEKFEYVNLKCDPDYALELRAENSAIRPGYHMSKKHWNSVYIEAGEKLLKSLTDHSYDLVVSKLSKKDQEALRNL